jgi:hypothetical protein
MVFGFGKQLLIVSVVIEYFNETEIQRFKNEASKQKQKQKAKNNNFYKQNMFFCNT